MPVYDTPTVLCDRCHVPFGKEEVKIVTVMVYNGMNFVGDALHRENLVGIPQWKEPFSKVTPKYYHNRCKVDE